MTIPVPAIGDDLDATWGADVANALSNGRTTVVIHALGGGLDDAAPIRAVLAAADPGTTIVFPDANYLLKTTVGGVAIDVRLDEITFVGRGSNHTVAGGTTFTYSAVDVAAGVGIAWRWAYPTGELVVIGGGMQDININGGALTGRILTIVGGVKLSFTRVQLWDTYDDTNGYALELLDANEVGSNSTQCTFDDCVFLVGGDSVAVRIGGAVVNCYAIRFDGCGIRCEDGIGASITDADDVWFTHCQFPVAGTGKSALLINAQAVQFIGSFQMYGAGVDVRAPLAGGSLMLGMSTVDSEVFRPVIEAGAGMWYLDDYGRHTFRPDPASMAGFTEDFFGLDDWTVTGGTAATIASVAHHAGIERITTGTVDETLAVLALGATGIILPAEGFWCNFILRFNSTLDTSVVYRIGLMDDPTSDPPANGIYAEKVEADTTWFAVTRSGGTQTRTALAKRDFTTDAWVDADVASGSWLRLQILRRDTDQVALGVGDLVNGQASSQHTTNIPTAALVPAFQVKNKTTTSKTLDVDLFQYHVIGLTR